MSTYTIKSITRYNQTDLEIKNYLSQIKLYPMLTEIEEKELATNVYERQDRASAEKLVMSHMRLVVKMAYDMNKYGAILFVDLVSEGSIGLIQAVKKFNPTIGVRFATYAQLWVKAYMHEYIMKSWSLVRIGTTSAQKKLFFNLKKAKEKILIAHGDHRSNLSDTDCKTLAIELSVTTDEIKEMDTRLGVGLSLDAEVEGEEGGRAMLDYIADTNANTESSVIRGDTYTKQHAVLAEAISRLTAREADIIRCRHLKDKSDTLEKLREKYKVSKERIRQIEEAALTKITTYCRNNYKQYGNVAL